MKKLFFWKNRHSTKTYFLAILGLVAMVSLLCVSLHSGIPGFSMAAILAGPYLRGAKNKFAGGVIYKHFGQTCLRERVTPTNTITVKKTLAQSRFKLVIPWLKLMDGFIDNTSTTSKRGQSKFNRIVGFNLKNGIHLNGGVWEWLWSGFAYCLGSLPLAKDLAATNPSAQTIIFTWVDNSGEGYAMADDVFAYLYVNTTTMETEHAVTVQMRSDQSYSYSAPALWTGDDVAIYGSFMSADGKRRSDSFFCGYLTLK